MPFQAFRRSCAWFYAAVVSTTSETCTATGTYRELLRVIVTTECTSNLRHGLYANDTLDEQVGHVGH